MDGQLIWSRTIGGPNTSTGRRHCCPMNNYQTNNRLDSGGNRNTETEITNMHPFSTRQQRLLYDRSSDWTRMAVEIVHKKEEIIIRRNDSASILDSHV